MNLTQFSNEVISRIFSFLLLFPLLIIAHYIALPILFWMSRRFRESRYFIALRRILLLLCLLPLAYPVLLLILPQYGATGEPIGVNYTGAFVACLVGAALLFAYLLLFFLFIRALSSLRTVLAGAHDPSTQEA